MTILLEYKERLKNFYSNYEVYFKPLIRFVAALVSFFLITREIGFMTKLQNPAIILILALLCAFLPANVTVLAAAALVIAHLSAASMEFALVMLVIFLVLFLLYFRFAPSYSYVILLTPVACALKIPFAVPIIMGLVASPIASIPIALGTMLYYLIEYAKVYAASMSGSDIENMFQKYQYIISHSLNRPEMFLMMIALVATVILVYAIRRLSVDYAWLIAIVAGGVAAVLIMLSGVYILEVPVDILSLIAGVAVAVLLALLVRFFAFNVDYTRTERVQFEDDEYYYYVKAIPKVTIATKEKSVKRIIINKKRDVQTALSEEEEQTGYEDEAGGAEDTAGREDAPENA